MLMKKVLFAFAFVAALAACDKTAVPTWTNPEPQTNPDGTAFNVKVAPVITKVTETKFENGDAIGITITREAGVWANNEKLVFDGSEFKGDLKWYAEGTDKASVVAYYPYSAEVPTSFTVAADQTAGSSASDFVAGSLAEAYPSAEAIVVPFQHKLSLIVFNVVKNVEGELVGITLDGAKLKANLAADFTATADEQAAPGSVKAYKANATRYALILPPQTVALTAKAETAGGNILSQVCKEVTLEGGKKYNITLVVNPGNLLVVLPGDVEDWTDGGDIPQPIVKEVPVMLSVDETAVESNAFRADWTSGGDVSSYTLKVNRQPESGATLLMSENFSNVNTYTDGFTDISGELDSYTDNPGWTGFKVYTAAGQSLKIGTSSAIGYLVSPDLQLSSTVTVVFRAKNWINSSGSSDNASVIVSCGEANQTVALSDSPEDYTVVLNGCTAQNIKLAMNAAKKRSYIYSVNIYDGDLTAIAPRREVVEEGDSTWRMVSGIVDTCYTVRALDGGIYEYMVKAIYTDGTESVWSNIQHVTLVGGGEELLVGDVNNDGEVNISDVTALIDYILGLSIDNFNIEAADVNSDGEINIGDVTAVIDIILGAI